VHVQSRLAAMAQVDLPPSVARMDA
jgi:hypothetical protein